MGGATPASPVALHCRKTQKALGAMAHVNYNRCRRYNRALVGIRKVNTID